MITRKMIAFTSAIVGVIIVLLALSMVIYRDLTDVSKIQEPEILIECSFNAALLEAHASKSDTYLVDCSRLFWVSKEQRIHAFRNFANIRDTSVDALLKSDTTWLLNGHPRTALVQYDSISRFGNTVTVEISIVYGLDAGQGVEIELVYKDGRYTVTKSGVVWIS